jgi:hypothetical protein
MTDDKAAFKANEKAAAGQGLVEDRGEKAIGALLEWTKNITGLATGTLVLSATLLTVIDKQAMRLKGILIGTWILFGLTVLFGVLLLGNVCFLFSTTGKKLPSIYNPTTRTLANLNLAMFVLGLAGFLVFVSFNL